MKRVNLYLSEDMLNAIKKIGTIEEMSQSQLVRSAVLSYIRTWKKEHGSTKQNTYDD